MFFVYPQAGRDGSTGSSSHGGDCADENEDNGGSSRRDEVDGCHYYWSVQARKMAEGTSVILCCSAEQGLSKSYSL